MSTIPDFTTIPFQIAEGKNDTLAEDVQLWETPEGINVKPSYGQGDRDGIDFLDTWPGIAPFLRGPYTGTSGSVEISPLRTSLKSCLYSPRLSLCFTFLTK